MFRACFDGIPEREKELLLLRFYIKVVALRALLLRGEGSRSEGFYCAGDAFLRGFW